MGKCSSHEASSPDDISRTKSLKMNYLVEPVMFCHTSRRFVISRVYKNVTHKGSNQMNAFLDALRVQRWDDHRYYHHSRINQALHLVSALSFVTAYVLIFTDPVAAALLGWLVAMTSRQIGHFFFEPKDYDEVNQ